MTPQERDLIADLFDRLTTLETAPRDPEAARAIADGLRQAPNAIYPLVQTVLVQDDALKRADARIKELQSSNEPEPAPQPTGFLDSIFGRRDTPRGSVPSVRPGAPSAAANPAFGASAAPGGYGAQWQQPSPGGSFLGTAASAAAGMIGGALLLDGIRSMMGHRQGGFGAVDQAAAATHEPASPWLDSSGGNLARDAGIDDIGRVPPGSDNGGDRGGFGLFDDHPDDGDEDFDDGGDFGDGGGDGGQ